MKEATSGRTSSPTLDVDNLNKLIRHWRKEKLNARDPLHKQMAACYIDAFQTVRVNNGLPPLPMEEDEEEHDESPS